MSRPWLQDDYKHSSKSRSKSPLERRKPRVDQFGRTLPSVSRSKSRSRSGSRGRSRRQVEDFRHSRESSRSGQNREGPAGYGREKSRDGGRSKERGRKGSRERRRPRKREGSSSSSSSASDRSSGSAHTRIVASTKPKYLNARLFVANIVSKDVTKDELIKQFEKYGNVVDVLVHPRNYAFIQYLKEEHARLAVEGEHGSTMKGWRLDVKMANENRKGGGVSRGGGRGGTMEHGGRAGRGNYGSLERDRSPIRDDPMRDPYLDPYRTPGPRGSGHYPPPGDFALRDPYYPPPDLYRRGYPDPWLPPDDPYRRDPYLDPFRDSYTLRPPPPPIECEIFVVNSQLRAYGEAVEHRVKEHNIITTVSVIPEGRTAPQMIEELTAQHGLFAIFINPQNEMHRSLTLNILHGTPQEHRNMPLDDAIALVGRSFLQYVEGLREKANAAAVPLSSASSATRVFLPASPEVAYLLNLLADNRALAVQELNTVIKYLQERRDKLIDAESRPIITDDGLIKNPPSQHTDRLQPKSQEPASINMSKDIPPTQDLASKILSIFSSAGGSIQGVPPANGTQQAKPPTGTPAPPPPPSAAVASSASLINFDNPNVQKALDNLIQSTPSLLKNFNTKTSLSSSQMGVSNVSSSSLGSLPTLGYGQGGGLSTSTVQTHQNQGQGQMQGGMPNLPSQGGMQGLSYGGMQINQPGMSAPGLPGQNQMNLSGYSMLGQGMQGQIGRGYGQQR